MSSGYFNRADGDREVSHDAEYLFQIGFPFVFPWFACGNSNLGGRLCRLSNQLMTPLLNDTKKLTIHLRPAHSARWFMEKKPDFINRLYLDIFDYLDYFRINASGEPFEIPWATDLSCLQLLAMSACFRLRAHPSKTEKILQLSH